MHNGFVRVDDEKMSKSLGNFFTMRDVLQKFDAEVVRFFILRAHYRSPLNYSDRHLDDASSALTRLYTALKECPPELAAVDWNAPYAQRFKAAMDDDFDTPEAVAVLFELANEVNRGELALAPALRALGGVLGLLQRDPQRLPPGRGERRRAGGRGDRRADRGAGGGAQGARFRARRRDSPRARVGRRGPRGRAAPAPPGAAG